MTSTGGGRRGRLMVRAAVLVPLAAGTGACRDLDCTPTRIRAEPASIATEADAVIRVRVTADDAPVAGTAVAFSVQGADGKSALLDVGNTRTDAEGVAEYRLANEMLSSYVREQLRTATQYEAISGKNVGGRYCRASAKAAFSFTLPTQP